MNYKIIISPSALKMLKTISDRRIRERIRDRIQGLSKDPEKQGKPLTGELSGYRSLRAVGQRYRIVYRVEKEKILVYILAMGIRKEGDRGDIYTLAKKLIRLRLLDPPEV